MSAKHLLETKPPPEGGSIQALRKSSLQCLITAEHSGLHVATVCSVLLFKILSHTESRTKTIKIPHSLLSCLLFTLFTWGMISLMSNSSQMTQISQFHFLRWVCLSVCCSSPAGCWHNQPHITRGEVRFPCANLNFYF